MSGKHGSSHCGLGSKVSSQETRGAVSMGSEERAVARGIVGVVW